jgi:nucleotide-binding universal stress UspA family protein
MEYFETVAAVDGSATDAAVLRWALDDASRHRRSLRVLHVNVWPARALALRPAWAVPPDEASDLLAHRILDTAVDRARQLAADLADERRGGAVPVTGELVTGLAADVLVGRTAAAGMVALGIGGTGKGGGMREDLGLGSTALQIARHAAGPVTVVRDTATVGVPTAAGRVVVGVDGSPRSQSALAAGFEEASLRRAELLAVHAWHSSVLDAPAMTTAEPPTPEELTAEQQRILSEAMVGWQEKYPDVSVSTRIAHAHAAVALIEATAAADLLVVSSRGGGGFRELLLGSVTRAVLHRARCTVMVIHQR